MRLNPTGRFLVLPKNIRHGWKWQRLTKTQTYCFTESITAAKSLIVQAHCVNAKIRQSLNYGQLLLLILPHDEEHFVILTPG